MKNAGIDVGIYTPHRIRVAAMRTALHKQVSINTILKSVDWTGDSTFRKHYKKPVEAKGQLL